MSRPGAIGALAVALLVACSGEAPPDLPELGEWTGEPQVGAKIRALRRAALDEPTPEAVGRLGMTFHAHDLFAPAIACYREAAKLAPGDPRWAYLEAQARSVEDLEGSLDGFRKALELGLEQPALHVRLGDILQRLGRFDEARSEYRRALALEPATTHALLGLAQLDLGTDPEAALARVEEAARIAPWHGEVHTLLAQVEQRLGREEEAELSLLRAGAFPNPSKTPDPLMAAVDAEAVSSLVYRLSGQRLAERGQFVEAEAEFRKVLGIVTDLERDYANLGGALTGQGRFDEAIEQFHKALEINPEDAFTHNNLAMALAGKGELDAAVGELERAVEIDPSYADAHRNLGLLRSRQRRFEEAVGHFREALLHAPSMVSARNDLGRALADLGRMDEGIEEWRRALEIDGRALPALYNLSIALAQTGAHREAIDWLRRGLEVAPNSSRLVSLLAWELATAPDPELRDGAEAEALGRRVYQAYPGQPAIGDVMAAALAERGDFDAAVEVASRALEQARTTGQPELAARIERRLERYRLRRPFRQPV